MYISFLLFVDWNSFVLLPESVRELSLRVLFLSLIAYLSYQQGEANRSQARRYQNVAEQLAEANENLQAPKPPFAGPSGWLPWDNSPPAWPTNSEILWER